MSTYTLTPSSLSAINGTPWANFGGSSVVLGSLSDSSDSTGIRWGELSGGAYAWLNLSTQTVPANEVASGCRITARSRRTAGAGRAYLAPAVGGSDVGFGSSLAVPVGASFATATGGVQSKLMSQDEVDGLRLLLSATTNTLTSLDLAEVSVDLVTASLPQAPVIASPSGSVTDVTRPAVAWTHMDRTEASVTLRARSGFTRTLTTSAAHGFAVGQMLRVSIGNANYDGSWPITAVPTSTTVQYEIGVSGTEGTTATSGTAWIGDDKVQAASRVAVFTAAQYGITDFDPATSPATWRNAEPWTGLPGPAQSATPDVDLANGTYRVYVQTAVTIAGQNSWSPWTYSAFTMAVVPQAAPDLAATWDETTNKVVLQVQGRSNMLSENQANGTESAATTGWAASTNCTVTSSTTQARSGSRSLRLSSTASGTMSATTPTGTSGVPVVEGQPYTALAYFRAGASARSCSVSIVWYTAAGSSISTSAGTGSNDSTSDFSTQRAVTATAPTSAAFAAVLVTVAATGGASELHYVDEVLLAPGTVTGWTPGGQSGFELFLERSSDAGETWTRVRTPGDQADGAAGIVLDASQSLTVDDHEAPRGAAVTYRASVVSSTLQASTAATDTVVTTLDGLAWVKALDHPELNTGFRLLTVDGYSEGRDTGAEKFTRPGKPGTFVVRHPGTALSPEVSLTTETTAEYEALLALLDADGDLLLQHVDVNSEGVGRDFVGSVTDSVRSTPIAPADGVWRVSFVLTVHG